jgi:hypothetical protein
MRNGSGLCSLVRVLIADISPKNHPPNHAPKKRMTNQFFLEGMVAVIPLDVLAV